MFVDEDGTGRRMFETDCFSRRVRVLASLESRFMELDRLRLRCDRDSPRDSERVASPKMKNLMKAPMRRTTDSWPRRKPCVKDRLDKRSAKKF